MKREHSLILCILIWIKLRSINGACTVQVSNLKAAGLASPANAAAVDWDYQASGCSVSNWEVHYDAAAPVEKLKSRGQANAPSHMKSYIMLDAGSFYNIYVEADTSTGEKIKSSNIIYPSSNQTPGSFPPNFHATSTKYQEVSMAWDKCDPAKLNGGFKSYSITCQDQVTRKAVTVEITDKGTLNKTFSGLVSNRKYVFLIRCGNDAGYSSYSTPVSVTTPPPPCNVVFSNLNTTMFRRASVANVIWDNKVTGCAVKKWIVHYDSVTPVKKTNSAESQATSSSITFPIRVVPSFNYKVYIEAITDGGKNFTSPVMYYSSPHDKPNKGPPNFNATSVTPDSVSLSWDKLGVEFRNGDIKGYSISSYDMATKKTSTTSVVGEDKLNTTISGLTPGNVYKFVIACVNDKGQGPSSPVITITLPKPTTTTTTTTPAPTTTKASCKVTFSDLQAKKSFRPGLATVSWNSTRTGCTVNNWIVHYDSTAPVRIFKNINHTHTVVGSIQQPLVVNPNFDYSVYVQAITDTGQIFKSPIVHYKAPKDRPYKAPSRFHSTGYTHDSVSFAWDKLDLFSKNGDVKGYQIFYNDMNTSARNSTFISGENIINTTLTGLNPGHKYQFVIKCVNEIGEGPYSNPLPTITLPPLPTTTTASTTSVTTPTATTSQSSSANTVSTVSTITAPRTGVPISTNNNVPKTTPGVTATTPSHGVQTMAVSGSATKAIGAVTSLPITSTTAKTVVTTPSKSITTSAVVSIPPNPEAEDADEEEDGGAPLWEIIAIVLGCLLLLAIAIAVCCHFCCFAGAAVDSDKDDEERVFRKKNMEEDERSKTVTEGRKNRTYSGISLQSVDEADLAEDHHTPSYDHRRESVDSLEPLTAPVIIAASARSKRKGSKDKPATVPFANRNPPKTYGTQFSEPVPVNTNRSFVLTPSSIKPITLDTPRRDESVQANSFPMGPLSTGSSLPLGASAMGGMSNAASWTTVDTPRKTTPFSNRTQSRGTSPGIPRPTFADRATSPDILTQPSFKSQSRGTSPGIPSLPSERSQNRGVSPIPEMVPERKRSSISDYPNVPQYSPKDSITPPVRKIEYNTIYKNHVNNTDNTFINNMFPNSREKDISKPGTREPPISKPHQPLALEDKLHTPRGLYDSVLDGKEESMRMITPGLDKPTFFNNIPKLDVPIPRALLYESKDLKRDWSDC